jgi:protocatechuate 3,4-dioxygenase beta subunit
VVIRLRRGASFAGTVFDANGRPASNIEVFAFRLEPIGGGQHVMLGGGKGLTNEQGNYEIKALPPGRYLLGGYRVLEHPLSRHPLRVLATGEEALESGAFYPDADSWDSAETLVLAPREARVGMNLRLHMNTVTTITGVVRGLDGKPSSGARVRLQLPQRPDLSVSDATTGQDGTFELTRVKTGNYDVLAYSHTGQSDSIAYTRPGLPTWGLVSLRSDGRTSSRVTIDLQPGATVAGRVRFDGVAPTLGPYQMHVFLNYVMGGNPWGVTQTDEWPNFSFRGVRPGRYHLTVSVHSVVPAWRMRSALVDGIDALDFPFEIAGTERRDVVVTMTQGASELGGKVSDAAGRPYPACSIVVFSRDQRYWTANSRRVDVVRPDTNGYYVLHDLPAGDYFVAMGAADIYGMPEPPVLTELSHGATRVTLQDSGKTVVDLKVPARPRLN